MKTTKWVIDPSHSEIHFKAKHLMITNVTGSFGKYLSNIETSGDDLQSAKIEVTIDPASINTGMEMRDNHLKSDDFFNAEKFPNIHFKSTKFEHRGDDKYSLEGDLTIRDVTKKVHLDALFLGNVVDSYGNYRMGWEVTGKISRKEFDLKWSAVTEAGSIVVSDDIRIESNVQYIKQAAEERVAA